MLRFTPISGYRDPGLPRDLLTCAILESAPEGLRVDLFCPGSRLGARRRSRALLDARAPGAAGLGRVRTPRRKTGAERFVSRSNDRCVVIYVMPHLCLLGD